ncbi:WD40 repeat domain-containing protein [Actinoplanes sp. NPDC049599]|uniref:WD40 repeat domain-containing protein n=1 Tax=Actinoplanes sp. NPDC049599 TaxID=3363903 RepID=UPI0037B8F461
MGPAHLEKAGPPAGTTLATSAYTATLIYDLGTGAADDVTSLSFSPTANRPHPARIWDVATGDLLCTLVGHHSPVPSVTFAPDGLSVATGADEGVRIWALPGR